MWYNTNLKSIIMKIFLKILNYFFTTLGIIFFIILLLATYLFFADPFNLKPLFSSFGVSPGTVMEAVTGDKKAPATENIEDKNPLLNAEQEKILESVGIDPEALPTEVTPELEDCLVEKVGEQRAAEIAKGAEPTAMDILKASACLK